MIEKNASNKIARVLICLTIIINLLVPLSYVRAVDVSVTITPNNANVGDNIIVSGTADPNVWVTIKVMETNGNIIYLNSIVSNNDGSYTDIFIVPEVSVGQLQIVSGYGGNTSTAMLPIIQKQTPSEPESTPIPTPTPTPEASEHGKVIEIKTSTELVMLSGYLLEDEASEDELLEKGASQEAISEEQKNIKLIFKNVEKEDLTAYCKADAITKHTIGDRPVIEINYMEDGKVKPWENSNEPVNISIPYTLQPEEDSEHIVVWYIDREGKYIPISNGRYRQETGRVDFHVTHLGTYAIAYVEKTFNDLDGYLWAKHPIEVLASKGIISGIGNNKYAPGKKVTRADFSTLLIQALELEADYENNFKDVHQTDYYYDSVGIAKELGIIAGTGNNMFMPKAYITRQDMMVMVDKALRLKGIVNNEYGSILLDIFSDKSEISLYAMDSVLSLVSQKIIVGSNNMINPLANVTRAEAAVVMYKIYNNMLDIVLPQTNISLEITDINSEIEKVEK